MSALQHLPAYLALLVHLAGRAGELGGIITHQWPAPTSSSQQRLQQLVNQAQHGPLLPAGLCQKIKELTCIRDILSTALRYMSGRDQPQPQDVVLLDCLADALEHRAGLSRDTPPALERSCSPGLLHQLLHTHLLALLKAAADQTRCAVGQQAALDNHRAVNALHLARQLLRRPGLQQQYSRQLLLPCLAFPVVEVLRADPGRCPQVQLQVFLLLAELLAQPGPPPLLPQQPPAPAGQIIPGR